MDAVGWAVVINGGWNPAILTPDGIRKRLLNLPDGTPIQVEVAIDFNRPPRVVHDELIIVSDPTRLEIALQSMTAAKLEAAAQMCAKAIDHLPETPFGAAGVNLRYAFAQTPDRLLELITPPFDNALSDLDFRLAGSGIKRTLIEGEGYLNVEVNIDASAAGSILLNYHKASTSAGELKAWLSRAREFEVKSTELLDSLGLA